MDTAAKIMIVGIALGAAIVGLISGLKREQDRSPPLPPQASQVGQLLVPGDLETTTGLRQTSFRVPSAVEDVRRFYRQALADRGWRYCGTQATARCTNIRRVTEAASQWDVYRRAVDRDATGATIEIWPRWDAARGATLVTVVETTAPR